MLQKNKKTTKFAWMTVAEKYIEICFELEKYKPGLVDAYFGPQKLRTSIEAQPKKPLQNIINQIDAELEKLKGDDQRTTYLKKQFIALHTIARLQTKEKIPYREEVKLLYDIEPAKINESVYEQALKDINTMLPGKGSLQTRTETYKQSLCIPKQNVVEIVTQIAADAQKRTRTFFPLPSHEHCDIKGVHQKPWSAYNWFQGDAFSLIEINLDQPFYLYQLFHITTHEIYPGHHTELCMKEEKLVREKGYLEFSIIPLFSPHCVIAEGIADMACEMIFDEEEIFAYLQEKISPRLKLDIDMDLLRRFQRAQKKLRSLAANVSLLVCEEKISGDEAKAYFQTYGLLNEDEAKRRLEFVNGYRGYCFTYHVGYDLLQRAFQKKDARKAFAELLSTPAYPSLFKNGECS